LEQWARKVGAGIVERRRALDESNVPRWEREREMVRGWYDTPRGEGGSSAWHDEGGLAATAHERWSQATVGWRMQAVWMARVWSRGGWAPDQWAQHNSNKALMCGPARVAWRGNGAERWARGQLKLFDFFFKFCANLIRPEMDLLEFQNFEIKYGCEVSELMNNFHY
jgi:hypothetical protein